MKKFLTAALSVIMICFSFVLTACNNNDVKLTYVALVNNSTGFTASDGDTAIAVGLKKGSLLKAPVDEYLETLTSEYKKELMSKMVALANDNKATYVIDYNADYTPTKGTLKVGMECSYTPYNWTQNNSNNGAIAISNVSGKYANGYDVQIAAKLACALGYKLEIYQYKWEALVPAVQSGTLDLIIAGMSPTEERLQEIDFSVNYYQSNLVVVTREGSKIASAESLADLDKEGISIAAQPGTFHLLALQEQTSKLTVVSSYEDFVDMKIALEAGLIDGYVAEEPTAMSFC